MIWFTIKIIFYFDLFIMYFFKFNYLSFLFFYFPPSFLPIRHNFLFEVNTALRARRVCARHRPKRCSPRGWWRAEPNDKNTPPVRAIKIVRMWTFQFGRDDDCSDAMTFVRRCPKRNQTMFARGGDVRANHPGTPETNENSRVFSFLFFF